jgi:hypothetical protein
MPGVFAGLRLTRVLGALVVIVFAVNVSAQEPPPTGAIEGTVFDSLLTDPTVLDRAAQKLASIRRPFHHRARAIHVAERRCRGRGVLQCRRHADAVRQR